MFGWAGTGCPPSLQIVDLESSAARELVEEPLAVNVVTDHRNTDRAVDRWAEAYQYPHRPREIVKAMPRTFGTPDEERTASGRMRRQVRRDTAAELVLRRLLHRRGLRYFIHRRPLPKLRREADLIFPRVRVAVFVDGCFWHGCPDHATWPKTNAEFWRVKIEKNAARDRETVVELESAGWVAVRVWSIRTPTTQRAALRSLSALVKVQLFPPITERPPSE